MKLYFQMVDRSRELSILVNLRYAMAFTWEGLNMTVQLRDNVTQTIRCASEEEKSRMIEAILSIEGQV